MKARKRTPLPCIAIIGAGNLGRVLALALRDAGYRITELISRPGAASQRHAMALAKKVDARAATLDSAKFDCEVVWLTVPDDAIAEWAAGLAAARSWRGKSVIHCSGALPAAELLPLKRRGAAIASAHPMNSFVAKSKPDFTAVPFALEGDKSALRIARQMITAIGADAFNIRAADKVLYHAFGAFSSPLLIALLEAGEQVGRAAGVKDPRRVNAKILQQSLNNYLTTGPADAFSGPLKRGDSETIRRHLAALKRLPEARDAYLALARSALRGLPVKSPETLWQVLK